MSKSFIMLILFFRSQNLERYEIFKWLSLSVFFTHMCTQSMSNHTKDSGKTSKPINLAPPVVNTGMALTTGELSMFYGLKASRIINVSIETLSEMVISNENERPSSGIADEGKAVPSESKAFI